MVLAPTTVKRARRRKSRASYCVLGVFPHTLEPLPPFDPAGTRRQLPQADSTGTSGRLIMPDHRSMPERGNRLGHGRHAKGIFRHTRAGEILTCVSRVRVKCTHTACSASNRTNEACSNSDSRESDDTHRVPLRGLSEYRAFPETKIWGGEFSANSFKPRINRSSRRRLNYSTIRSISESSFGQ